jgi:lactoylglutathione lyase
MGIGTRIQQLRMRNAFTQEQLAEKLNVSRQSVSKWEMGSAIPEIEKIIMMSKLFLVCTDQILLEECDIKKIRPQVLHFSSIYLIVRDFEKAISFYEKLLSMNVSSRNCGNKFAEFFFDNKCLALMNEANIENHHYSDGDHKFVLTFWVEDLEREYERLRNLSIGKMTDIFKVHAGYYYFHIFDADDNVVEITGRIKEYEEDNKE